MTRQSLDTFASILGYSFLVCVAMQLFTFGMATLAHDWAYGLHSRFFHLTPETFDQAIYNFLSLMKILGLTLFLAPWIATKIVAAKLPA